MSHRGFRLTVQLRTEAIFSPLMTLDALLAAAIYRETGDVVAAHRDLPLAQRDDCWCASSAILRGGFFTDVALVSRLTRNDMDPGKYTDRKRNGRATIVVGGGLYVPRLDHRRAWIGRVEFEAVGDQEECQRLVESLPGLGSKTNMGFGEILEVSVEEAECDGLRFSQTGNPARPVPMSVWTSWGYEVAPSTPIDQTRWQPPYWQSEASLCVLPVVLG